MSEVTKADITEVYNRIDKVNTTMKRLDKLENRSTKNDE